MHVMPLNAPQCCAWQPEKKKKVSKCRDKKATQTGWSSHFCFQSPGMFVLVGGCVKVGVDIMGQVCVWTVLADLHVALVGLVCVDSAC